MKNKEKVAIVKIVTRNNSTVKFAALLPQQEILDEDGIQAYPPGMHVIYLPFADDLRETEFEENKKATEEQISKAKKLVKTLRINFDSNQFENPHLQRHYSALQALALDKDQLEDTPDYTLPDEEVKKKFYFKIHFF